MLKKLKEALAAQTAELETLTAKAFGNDGTEEDLGLVDGKSKELDALIAKIKIAEAAEKHIAASATPADGGEQRGSDRVPAQMKSPETAAEKIGVAMQAMMKAYHEDGTKGPRATLRAMEEMGYGKAASEFGAIQKANTTLTGSSGGFMVAENFDRSFMDLLYVESAFMQGNPTRIPMPEGNYRQAGAATGATATYRGEGDDIAVSNPTFRDVSMSAHLLSNIVPVTNQLIRYSLGAAADFIRTDGAMAMSLKMDETALLGSGTGDVPLGIFNQPGINKIAVATATTTTPNVAAIEAEVKRMIALITRYPVLRNRAAWVMSPRTLLYLSMLRGADDQSIYPSLQGNGRTWLNLPVLVAGTLPENLGVGTNEGYIALVSFGNVLIGEAKGLSIDISTEASYGAPGTYVNAFSTDSTLFRFTMEHDFGVRYVEAVNVLTGVVWGG